jgi:hypothetical protein
MSWCDKTALLKSDVDIVNFRGTLRLSTVYMSFNMPRQCMENLVVGLPCTLL